MVDLPMSRIVPSRFRSLIDDSAQTYTAALFLMILSMICWGSWANTYKLPESGASSFTTSTLPPVCCSPPSFWPTRRATWDTTASRPATISCTPASGNGCSASRGRGLQSGQHAVAGAISVAGMAVAFPVGIGLALIIGVLLNFILRPAGMPPCVRGLPAGVGGDCGGRIRLRPVGAHRA